MQAGSEVPADRRRPYRLFAAIGRFAVRRRAAIVAFWLAAAAAALALLPPLGSVTKNDSTAFLPADAPSVLAAKLAAPFLVANPQSGTLIGVAQGGSLTRADQAAFTRIERLVRGVPGVVAVHDGAVSIDGQARTANIRFAAATAGGGRAGAASVGGVRTLAARRAPAGLSVYLTGPLPELVDQQSAASGTAIELELLSPLLILLVLGLVFRSLLAPVVTLLPAGITLAVAEPLIAESSRIGVQVSSLMELLLTALVLGAGTDYGLFLIFRYREHLRQGMDPTAAVVGAVARVGESITFSAATVIAALMSLLLASFGLYRGVGPGLAIGIAVVLAVELTLFPALLALLGPRVFWPDRRPADARLGVWGRVAGRVSRRPVVALCASGAGLGLVGLCLLAYAPSGFNPGGYIAGSNSGIGQAVLADQFGEASLNTTDVLFRLRRPVWDDPSVIATALDALEGSRAFASVSGALTFGGGQVPPRFLSIGYRLLGPPALLPAVPPSGARVPTDFYNAYRSTAGYISPNGRTVLYRTALGAGSPGSTAAMQAVPAVRAIVASVGRRISATDWGVAGQAAGAADVSSVSGRDIVAVTPVVLVVLAVLLAIVLRSLVAPLYLVATVALSYAASLGLAVFIFVVAGHELGINFTLPFFMFVFVMALGEDYNILIMTRIREEHGRLPLRRAVEAALGTTGTTVTSAGLVLAGTFGVLAAVTSGQIRQIGTGLALGVLLDTFVVRTLLVPSVVVLLGRWNWWPSRGGAVEHPDPGPALDA